MASIVVAGDTSGSITLAAPAIAGSNTLTLPTQTATLATLTTPSFASTIGVGGATPAASGAGITFPATQSASSDANTLDDYEEGTWTPGYTLDGGSVSGVVSSGTYIKIGRQVTLTISLGFSTSSGGLLNNITGYPFTAQNTDQQGVGSVRENSNTGYQWHWRANSNDNRGLMRRYDNTQTIASGMSFVGTLTYFTA